MLVATNDGSQITVNIEDLKNIIKEELKEQVKEQVEEEMKKSVPKHMNGFITDQLSSSSSYTVDTKTGFTKTTDSNNSIAEYLSYSTTEGYTVLKSRLVLD